MPLALINTQEATKRAIQLDGHLEFFNKTIEARHAQFVRKLEEIEAAEGSLEQFSKSYLKFGFNKIKGKEGGVSFREWAPNAKEAYLFGDFNDWNRCANALSKDSWGIWSCIIPHISHGSKVKIGMITKEGKWIERIPSWIHYAIQERDDGLYESIFWNPEIPYHWKYEKPSPSSSNPKNALRIYEAHVGICTEKLKVNTFKEFKELLLPRISKAGYNAIQLMGIQEHAYYGSFGYQVTGFFAISSRFGTPDDFKSLVDEAHGLGLLVLLDLVHSHASKNILDGLNRFDDSNHHYFHDGDRGNHPLWDSRLFNYGNWETLRFLLSNIAWFRDEYKIDGFRFDGVTSMLYHHHGIGFEFSGDYQEYFGIQVDEEALVYLKLANHLLHNHDPCITIAEDVSGMPLLCRPLVDAGIGFDYRLAMAIPDIWIKLLKEIPDESWNLGYICHTLTNRRHLEGTISYAESHDQALVGDKTIAFWLMDKEMYTEMSITRPMTLVIDRGISLHKMIRLITFGLGGEGYLSFMGNEFGHPEWLDFPRHGNNWSYKYARRQYNLVDDPLLRYKFLGEFDRMMMQLDIDNHLLSSPQAFISLKHESNKIVAFERAKLLWVFNFHPSHSFTSYRIGVDQAGSYKCILNSDSLQFGGHDRIMMDQVYYTDPINHDNRNHSMLLYLPCRTAIVLKRINQ